MYLQFALLALMIIFYAVGCFWVVYQLGAFDDIVKKPTFAMYCKGLVWRLSSRKHPIYHKRCGQHQASVRTPSPRNQSNRLKHRGREGQPRGLHRTK